MKLIKIDSSSIWIRTDQESFWGVRINDLFAVYDTDVCLIAMVTSLSDTDAEERIGEEDFLEAMDGIKTISCSIIGSIKDKRFVKSVDRYPHTHVEVEKITPDIFEKITRPESGSEFYIGDYAEYGIPAWVEGNKFFQRHACIVGNTGSGKSETVAKILEEASGLPGANLIVFDVHGEYSGLSYADHIQIGEDFPFPIWMFGFSDIISNILKIREESATVVVSALRKAYYQVCPDGKENRPVYFSYDDLIRRMEQMDTEEYATGETYKTGNKAGMLKTVKGEYNGKLTSTVAILKDRRMDSRYSFLFAEKCQTYLYEVMDRILGSGKPVKDIDLSRIPHDVAISIVGVISKLVFDIQRQQDMDRIRPVVLVCDEAHVYIPNNFQLSASQSRMVEVFEDIAKEGRKFGITLFPATQRPSELNKTIFAQCANLIVGKLNNENDKSLVKGMLPDGDGGLIDSVAMFNPGDVIILGDSVPAPLKIKVRLAKERPVSRTINFWDIWKEGQGDEISFLVDRYLK